MSELAAICYVDICRAATYVSKDDTVSIRQFVSDVENELTEKLFDVNRHSDLDALCNSLGVYIDHKSLLADYLVTMYRFDIEKTVQSYIPICFTKSAPTIFKMSVVKAALAIVSEETKLPWVQPISSLYDPLCGRIRKLFLEFFNKDVRDKSDQQSSTSTTSRKPSSNSADKRHTGMKNKLLANERFELILDVLKLYQVDPKFAILVSLNCVKDNIQTIVLNDRIYLI